MAYTPDPTNLLAREIYNRSLSGKDDHAIAEDLDMDLDIVTAMREQYIADHVDRAEANPIDRSKWRDRIEVWIARLDLAYESGRLDVTKGVNAFVKLAGLGIDLDGLAASKKMDINVVGSKVDRDIEKLLGQFPAQTEEDTPL